MLVDRMAGIVDRMAGMARMAELFLRMQRMHADPKMHPGARAYQTCNPVLSLDLLDAKISTAHRPPNCLSAILSSLRSIEMHTARWAFGGPTKITEGFGTESRPLRVEIKLCSCVEGPRIAFGNSDPLDLSQMLPNLQLPGKCFVRKLCDSS